MYRWSDLPGIDYWADIPSRKASRKQNKPKAAGPAKEKGGEKGENRSEGRAKLNEAIQAGNRKDYQQAVDILEELISTCDTPPEAYLFLGRAFHALKDYSRALAAYNDFVRLRPQSANGYLYAGRTYLTLNMPQRGVPLFKKALERDPQNPITMALLGTAYLKSKHSREAADILSEAVETASQKALSPKEQDRIYRAYLNSLLIRGINLCRVEDYEMGIQMLRFVLENGPDMPLLRLELGRACREVGELDEAVEHYTQAINFSPRDARIRWYRASVLMSLGRNNQALEDLTHIRADTNGSGGTEIPDIPWNSELVDRYMIRSFLEAGEWRRAAESAKNWLKHRKPDPMIHAMYAEAQRNLKDFSSAENHLNRALELAPRAIELWYAMLLVAWEGEDPKTLRKAIRNVKDLGGDRDIIKRFSILLEAKTTDSGGEQDQRILRLLQNAVRTLGPEPEIMYALGERYLGIGLIEAAITWFKNTILVSKNHERSYLGEIAACEALVREGVPEARAELAAAYAGYLALWPDNHIIRREWALFLVHQGEFEAASREMETLLTWEPANPTLRRVLAYTYRKTGRFREAAMFLKGLLKEKPRDTGLILEYSGCLARAGATQYAIKVLEKALSFLTKSAEIPLALGLLLYRERKIEKAFELFREAIERDPKAARPWQWMAHISKQMGDTKKASKYDDEAKKRKKGRVTIK
ncbi:MAG: tetratricopeptide repeat protein [Spirochaetaceae bacterium]|jgi:tetratricopeptide (TPR) repeat protein|nr:tetratricopeptide repeat protein [Spirochaetaceae bacterium]